MRSTRQLTVPSLMDPGLSLRAQRTLKTQLPGFNNADSFDPFGARIDLSVAVNDVLAPELLEFFGDVVRDVEGAEVC
jgi:hypothetical protein